MCGFDSARNNYIGGESVCESKMKKLKNSKRADKDVIAGDMINFVKIWNH